jgi:hypothetical protein
MLATSVSLPIYVVILLAVFPSLFGVVGAYLVGNGQHRHERNQWLRDTRLTAYTDFSRACIPFTRAVWAYLAAPESDESLFDLISDGQVNLGNAASMVVVIGPAYVSGLCQEVLDAGVDLQEAATRNWVIGHSCARSSDFEPLRKFNELLGRYNEAAADTLSAT